MKEANDSGEPALRKRHEFQSLLDQLDIRIERDVSSPSDLNILSLRLLALHQQRNRQGHVTVGNERDSLTIRETGTGPLVTPKITTGPATPADVPGRMITNKLQSWLSRRSKG